MLRRDRPFPERRKVQQERLSLPRLPTTTIGSFPQTSEVRKARAAMKNGWVQSYGSRCVKPPLIFGDVSRPKAMTGR